MEADLQCMFQDLRASGRHSLHFFLNNEDEKGIYNPNFTLEKFPSRFKSLPLEKKTKNPFELQNFIYTLQ